MFKSSRAARLLGLQALLVGNALFLIALFWAIDRSPHVRTTLAYSLVIGNLITPPLNWVTHRKPRGSFTRNLLIFLAVLIPLTPLVYLVSSVIVWWIVPPLPQSLWQGVRADWKFATLITFAYGLGIYLYAASRNRLEARNEDLQRSVQNGAAQLAMQEEELESAREIQQALLPKSVPQLPGLEVATAWQPARIVGGDYFDVFQLGKQELAVCIADVAGKGICAALLMANVQASVRAFAREAESPARVCGRINQVLCENCSTDRFVTFFYAVLNGPDRILRYCNAGHPAPLLVSADSVHQLAGSGAALGLFPDWKYEEFTVRLSAGDRLVLYTDGITEAVRSDGEEFGSENLAAVAQASGRNPASELNRLLLAQVTQFCNGQFHDDATLLVVAIN